MNEDQRVEPFSKRIVGRREQIMVIDAPDRAGVYVALTIKSSRRHRFAGSAWPSF
jgi:hypothetical protein